MSALNIDVLRDCLFLPEINMGFAKSSPVGLQVDEPLEEVVHVEEPLHHLQRSAY